MHSRIPTREEELSELVSAIKEYLVVMEQRFPSRRRAVDATARRNAEDRLLHTVGRVIPIVARELDRGLPDSIYLMDVISFGISGMNDPLANQIWKEYYIAGGFLSEPPYVPRSVSRRKAVLPELIAVQLLMKEWELATGGQPPIPDPETLSQRRSRILQEVFHLSPTESRVLLTYCEKHNIGRAAIARSLSISENTLKSHQQSILRKMRAGSMNAAAEIAREALRKNPGAEWSKGR